MLGYWNQPEANAKDFTADGYFKTGDIGVFNAKGCLKIVDRAWAREASSIQRVAQLALVAQGEQQHVPLRMGVEHDMAGQDELPQFGQAVRTRKLERLLRIRATHKL
jgi:hypothetical protein